MDDWSLAVAVQFDVSEHCLRAVGMHSVYVCVCVCVYVHVCECVVCVC